MELTGLTLALASYSALWITAQNFPTHPRERENAISLTKDTNLHWNSALPCPAIIYPHPPILPPLTLTYFTLTDPALPLSMPPSLPFPLPRTRFGVKNQCSIVRAHMELTAL